MSVFFRFRNLHTKKGEDGTDYFAHHSRITSDQKRAFLKSGANVTFDLAENNGRQCADNITAV